MKTYKMFINLFKERYCFKCHAIKSVDNFVKVPPRFRVAGVCKQCSEVKEYAEQNTCL